MKNAHLPKKTTDRTKGIALILVVAVLSLLTVLTVAMFSVSETERSTSSQQVDQEQSRELADLSVNVVMGQIWQGTKQDPNTPGREIWASQPGAVRKYKNDGTFHSGYKLYSSSMMVVTGNEVQMIQDVAPANWNTLPARYVDLNEPVIRPPVNGSTKATVYFPIVDPRAYVSSFGTVANNPNVEGFFYSTTDAPYNGTNANGRPVPGVVMAGAVDDVNARLPMPVEWLYVLKDGTIGALNSANQFVKPDSSPLSNSEATTNPIVGRFAMWTDDECCKLNINTASEPTYWTTPSLFHDRDLWWAFYQPTAHEYQRYPGHPATVALSTVFFPNQDLDPYGKTSAAQKRILQIKESLYALAPKINYGGSKAGTVPYWSFYDSYATFKTSSYDQSVKISSSIGERLYASVDELYFSNKYQGNVRQVNNKFDSDDTEMTNTPLFIGPNDTSNKDQINLERARFFLTAQSRMPEVNMFGMPRVAVWPIADEKGIYYFDYKTGQPISTNYRGPGATGDPKQDYRTGFDQLIAFCCTLGNTNTANGGGGYFFRRQCAYDKSWDINLPRNKQLFNYLSVLLQQNMPGGASFSQKYSQDYQQILLEIFDYIRATNLYDGFLCPDKGTLQDTGANNRYAMTLPNGGGSKQSTFYPTSTTDGSSADGNYYRSRPTNFRTYTYDRASIDTLRGGTPTIHEQQVENTFPGHGMVVPTQYNGMMGYGRFLTIAEAGVQFICTADGALDKGSYDQRIKDGGKDASGNPTYKLSGTKSGGRTAVKIIKDTSKTQPGKALPLKVKDPYLKTQVIQPWYSNFPPQPGQNCYASYGVNPAETDPNAPDYMPNHPGGQPQNWNCSLENDKPLQDGERRVQGMFIIKLAMPAAGMTEMNPECTITVEGLNQLKIGNQQLFAQNDSLLTWKSQQSVFDATDCRPVGGCASIQAMTTGRKIGNHDSGKGFTADEGYDLNANTGGDPHAGVRNFDLTTNFVTIKPDKNSNMVQFTGGPLIIKLYSSHWVNAKTLCQTFKMTLVTQQIPAPQLVIASTDHQGWQNSDGTTGAENAVDAPHWWGLNYDGVLNRYTARWQPGNPRSPNGSWTGVAPNHPNVSTGSATFANDIRTCGRFYIQDGNSRANTSASGHAGKSTTDHVPRGASMIWAYWPVDGNYNSILMDPTNPAKDDINGPDMVSNTGYTDTQPFDETNPSQGNRDQRGQDTVFTMVPSTGDWRLVAGKAEYDDWSPHPRTSGLGQVGETGDSGHIRFMQYMAHNMSRFYSDRDAGYDRGPAPATNINQNRLVQLAAYNGSKIPDLPAIGAIAQQAWLYGDFDNGGYGENGLRDGAYINKPDEGDGAITFHYHGVNNADTVRLPNAYLSTYDYGWLFSDSGDAFMSPNRMIPSPGMFGSLPTGVNAKVGWKTLLFRPQTIPSNVTGGTWHPGAAGYQKGQDPADHYIMDLFWMPVVEPYAISEPFSTAGKININYQMVPFSHIRRATGLHAVLKGEMIKAVPFTDAANYNIMPGVTLKEINTPDGYLYRQPWTDQSSLNNAGAQIKVWHRNIDTETRTTGSSVTGTLQYFEDRFNFQTDSAFPGRPGGLFRTASQICEVPIIPKKIIIAGSGGDDSLYSPATVSFTESGLSTQFWNDHRLTGDNVRERPYANIYGKITTQSNTFRIHFRTQVIHKARSVGGGTFDPVKDAVLTDYRGSALIERRIDPSDPRIPDYGGSPTPTSLQPLDDFYQFRVLEVKRFSP